MKDVVFVDTQQGVSNLVDWISLQDTWLGDTQPPLYIDAEGERLGRDEKLSLLTILVYPSQLLAHPYILDIYSLGNLAFSTAGGSGKSLKHILETPKFIKVFFDVRNDSDALHFHYSIKLDGVRNVQLMENARR
ncbi:3'-5' exonuclease domain [Fusarium oxysporum f. sp. vasinfectum]|nr:3'-5' exonuclease domain [Fusarium oxysporum f. sp. vasinfectum]